MDAKQIALLEFVKHEHGEQKRKYTIEPYWGHCLSVAELVQQYEPEGFTFEIALCHDLIEDPKTPSHRIVKELTFIGYTPKESFHILDGVLALTDFYTHERYPYLKRKDRKRLECLRLSGIDPIFQSVKYADLIDNTSSIVANDPGFAKVYLAEKGEILKEMNKGNSILYRLACEKYESAIFALQHPALA